MKNQTTRNTALALTGLLALTLYILACTSFSPDDKKVLYPAFSGTNGAIGLASYDRQSRRSELVFLPANLEGAETNAVNPGMLRGQWLGDGRRILATWAARDNDDVLNVAVLPFGALGPVSFFTLPGKDLSRSILVPAPVVADRAFLMGAATQVVRLDLRDGTVVRHELGSEGSEWVLYPAADGKAVFYLEDHKLTDQRIFGRLDPETFALVPLLTFTNQPESGFSFTYDGSGDRLALIEKADAGARLVVLQRGKPALSRLLPGAGKGLELANAVFSRSGDTLVAGFRRQKEGAFDLLIRPDRDPAQRRARSGDRAHSGHRYHRASRSVLLSNRGLPRWPDRRRGFHLPRLHERGFQSQGLCLVFHRLERCQPESDQGSDPSARAPRRQCQIAPMLDALTILFARLCGQNPSHTWAPGGLPLPCCQRCTGLYAGAAVAAVVLFWLRPRLSKGFLEAHGLCLLVMAPLGLHWVPEGPVVRTLSGVLFGFGVAAFLWLPLATRVGWSNLPRSFSSPAYGLALMAALGCIPILAASGGTGAAYALAGLVGCGAVLLLALAVGAIGSLALAWR